MSLDQKNTNELVFPTDVAALFFGLWIFSAAIFFRSSQILSDPDTYWHIATGKWILEQGAFPRHEIFSHTALGQPWIDAEWLGQIILAIAHNFFGWRSLVLLVGVVVSLTFVLLYELLARELRPTVALGAAAVSHLFALPHVLARPHILTFPIIVIWTFCVVRASEKSRRPSFWLLLLMVLWANLHGGFTIGLVLAAVFGLEATISAPASRRQRLAIEWLVFCLGALLAGCLTPYGFESVLRTYYGLDLGELLNQISEWRPMDAHHDFIQQTILLCLLALALGFGARIGFFRLLIVVGLLYLGLRHVRALAIFALVVPLIVAHPLQQQFVFLRPLTDPYPLFSRRGRPFRTTIAVVVALIIAVGLGAIYAIMRPTEGPPASISPAAALDYAVEANLSGPVLNDFDFGGYLLFRGIPTFIDGRTLPFGKDFAQKYFDAFPIGRGRELEQLADVYGVSWTLLRPQSAAALHFDHSPNWQRIYADDIAVIHTRR